MKKHRLLIALLCLGLIAVLPAAAQTPTGTPPLDDGWLSFDGSAGPAQPTLSLLDAGPTAIDLHAGLPGAWVETVKVDGGTFSRLYGEGYGHGAEFGLPDLPVLRRDVEVPFGAQVTLELVSAEYLDHSLEELGLHPIYPLQPPVPKLPGAVENAPFVVDAGFYADGGPYPLAPLALGEPYVVRGHRVQPVEVWPVRYDPAAGTVRLYAQVTFRLVLEGSDMVHTRALAERYASPAFEDRLARQVLNYNQGRPAVQFGPETPAGYLIITADAYYDAMVPLANLRQGRGFDVTMTRLSDVPGGSTASAIRAYIEDAYANWPTPPSYVLLVGDTDTVPAWTGSSANEVTDLYYATMDGSTDWHPDIGRGRFPVRSAAQATIMVDKYLAYASFTGTEPWLKKAAFIATCDQYLVAEGTHNYVVDNHTLPGGYTGIFPNNPQPGGDKIYCVTYGGSATNIRNAANDGRWAIVYSGHGYTGGWGDGAVSFSQADVQNLTDVGFFPFVASHACVTGQFDVTESYAETWVLQDGKGALAIWASADNSYWDEDDILERAMFDSLFDDTGGYPDITEMTYYGLDQTEAMYPSRARYYWETYNILGDPAVKIFMEPDLPTFTLAIDPAGHEVCTSGAVTSTVQIGSILGYSATVYLETGTLPSGVTVGFDPISAGAPFTSALTLDVAAGAPAGEHPIVITATDHLSFALDNTVELRVVEAAPAVPELLSPPDGATGQPFAPTFEWEIVPGAYSYHLQLDRSPLFPAPLVDETGLDTTYTPAQPLEGGRCYWWRARGGNVCGDGAWADPFHFAIVALALGFSDDMESGPGQWSHQASQGLDQWALSDAMSHSPSHAWFHPDHGQITDSYLWNTAPVPVGSGSSLTFWHRHQFEGSFDGAVLEISTNGGVSWTDLGPHITTNGYNGTLSTSYGNPLGGRQAWVSDLLTWTRVEVNLGSFAGQDVLIRWRIGCDSSVSDVGWFIDDVQITSPLAPDPAPVVLSVTPPAGSAYAPTPVSIEGSDFVDTPSVKLGDTWLLSVTQVSSTTLDAVVPAGMAGGTYDLALYNGGDCQEATLAAAFAVIEDCISPTVTFESDSPVTLGQGMHFSATLSGTQAFSYTWDFGGSGDCLGCDTLAPVYTYTAPGWYTVALAVENACGAAATSQGVQVAPLMHPVYLPLIIKDATP